MSRYTVVKKEAFRSTPVVGLRHVCSSTVCCWYAVAYYWLIPTIHHTHGQKACHYTMRCLPPKKPLVIVTTPVAAVISPLETIRSLSGYLTRTVTEGGEAMRSDGVERESVLRGY